MRSNPPIQKIFTKRFILLSVISFLIANNFYTLLSVMPIYVLDIYGLTEAEAGLATGLFVVGMLSSRFISGRLVMRIGFIPMLLIGISTLVIFTILYQFIHSPDGLYIVRLCNGFAYGMTSNTLVTLVSTIIPSARSGEGVGYFSMFQMLAWAVGPYVGIQMAQNGGYTTIFLFCTILPAIALILIPFVNLRGIRVGMVFDTTTDTWIEEKLSQSPNKEPSSEKFLDKFLERTTLPIAITCLFVMLFNAAVISFVALYANTFSLSAVASVFFVVYVAAMLISRPIVSKLFDRKGANFVFIPGVIIYVFALILLSQATVGAMFLIAAAALGLGFGAVQTSLLALTVIRAPRQRLGFANATYYMSLDLCASLGPIIAGLLIPLTGYGDLYFIGAIYTSFGLLIYYRLIGRFLRKKNRTD